MLAIPAYASFAIIVMAKVLLFQFLILGCFTVSEISHAHDIVIHVQTSFCPTLRRVSLSYRSGWQVKPGVKRRAKRGFT
jgi:hypothetical protein